MLLPWKWDIFLCKIIKHTYVCHNDGTKKQNMFVVTFGFIFFYMTWLSYLLSSFFEDRNNMIASTCKALFWKRMCFLLVLILKIANFPVHLDNLVFSTSLSTLALTIFLLRSYFIMLSYPVPSFCKSHYNLFFPKLWFH